MIHSIYTITFTDINWLFGEAETTMHSRIFIDPEDAFNELIRLVLLDAPEKLHLNENDVLDRITDDGTKIVIEIEDEHTIEYRIQKTGMYDDQVEKLTNRKEYLEEYGKCVEAGHQGGLA